LVSAYTTAKNAAIAAVAAAEAATGSKDDAMENLTDAMKSDIRYAGVLFEKFAYAKLAVSAGG
jgi:hypothetical protein